MAAVSNNIDNGYKKVNNSVLRLLATAIADDSAADLLPLLQKLCETYKGKRKAVEDRWERKLKRQKVQLNSDNNTCFRPPDPNCELCLDPAVPPTIVQGLSPNLPGLLQIPPSTDRSLCEYIRSRINRGEVIWKGCSKVVMKLSDEVAVKIGEDLPLDDEPLLRLIMKECPEVPVTEPLGAIRVGSKICVLMSFIPGETLEKRWPLLTSSQKKSVIAQLDGMFANIRRIAYEPSTPLGSLSEQHQFKDTRATRRCSLQALLTLSACHDWMLSEPKERISPAYIKWLRTLLNDNYKIVLTHGDLHPRNVMVVEDTAGNIGVSGIIDWELGGWYPEYWEELKALNTRGTDDDSDWWENLPSSISGYSKLVAVHYLIEMATN